METIVNYKSGPIVPLLPIILRLRAIYYFDGIGTASLSLTVCLFYQQIIFKTSNMSHSKSLCEGERH